jgi:DNA-binding NarL/FixJ family response regulator
MNAIMVRSGRRTWGQGEQIDAFKLIAEHQWVDRIDLGRLSVAVVTTYELDVRLRRPAGRRQRVPAQGPPATASRLAALTDREREIVALVGGGLSNDDIAARLVISPLTAKTHVSRAMVKIDARDRAQLVVFAYEAGLVTPAIG